MAEIDTSIYKMPVQKSPLEMAGQIAQTRSAIQGNVSNDISISKQKLDLVTQQFGIMNNELAGLANDPSITKEQAAGRLNTIAKTLNLPPPVVQHMTDELNNSQPSVDANGKQITPVQAFAKNAMVRGMQTMDKVRSLYGDQATAQDNKNIYAGVQRSPMQGGGFAPSTAMPVQTPVGQAGFDASNKQQFEQPEGPSGVVPVRQGRPMPVQPLASPAATTGPTGPTVETTGGPGSPPATFAQRTDAAFPNRRAPLSAGPDPMFAASQAMLAKDREAATGKATALKPLEEAYGLAKLVSTGAGTETLNKARAYLTNAGLMSTDEKNPAVIYQMLNKNLAGFVDKNGTRSDADLAVKESSNANAKTQIQPALLHMIQKIIGREKIEIARPLAFEDSNVGKYSEHSSNFPTSQDERAYTIDKMPPDEARSLYLDMKNKALNGSGAAKAEAIKFLKSLNTAVKTKQVSGIQ